jgi:hypothetical protein
MIQEDFVKMRGDLECFATVHEITTAAALSEKLKSFDESKWAFRGQGRDWPLIATIDRYAIRPGVAEDYVMREFRRRAHQYLADLPGRDGDLEWLALMQHHGVPTRLLDWTRSSQVAVFFAADSSNSSSPFVRKSDVSDPPYIVWAVDTDKLNGQAKSMLDLPDSADISSSEVFRNVFWSQPPNEIYLAFAVQPYRMNERLTIQQGLFLYANRVLLPFHNCLAGLLHRASQQGQKSHEWLHKIVIAAETRAEVLRSLNKINVNAATLFPGLDGFSRSLQITVQLQELDGWPGVSLTTDRENWVKGT